MMFCIAWILPLAWLRRIGSATQFGVSENFPQGLAAIGDTLYMVGQTTDALYSVDTSTGVASRIGSATEFGVSESLPSGLGAIGDTLYMTGSTTDALYSVDTSTGVAAQNWLRYPVRRI